MSGIIDVAQKAGVAISTVSNVLNKSKYVSPELTKRVEDAARALGYAANPIARSMKNNRSKTIGVITEDMCGVFYPYLVRGINSVINQKGYQLMICDIQGTYGDERAFQREQELFHRLIASRVDGIIFVSCVPEAIKKQYSSELLREANQYKKIPLVSLERNFSDCGIDSVYFDGYNNAQMAVQHLIDCGCRRIAHITGPVGLRIAQERIEGMKECLRKNMLPWDDRLVVCGDYTHQSGFRCMRKLLRDVPNVDGVFCGNDQMAVGVLKMLKSSGRRVPEDIKIMGYDDIFLSSVVEPSLSTIHIQKNHSGIKAAKMLLERIEGGDEPYAPRGVKMEAELIIRQSTMANGNEDWILSEW